VLDSLNRLAELEQRISSLEKDNKYDQMAALEKPTANQRNSVEFKKKRLPVPSGGSGTGGPMAIKYEIKTNRGVGMKPKQWQVQLPRVIGGRKQTSGQEYESDYDGDMEEVSRGPGIFITEDNNGGGNMNNEKREALRRERLRQIALASDGQKNMRERIQMKKGRLKEQQMGAKKHEEAMRELARRKKEQSSANRPMPPLNNNSRMAGGAPSKGISAGIRSKNKHLQEFEMIKAGHKKRKGFFCSFD
jgi:hypothetical protein